MNTEDNIDAPIGRDVWEGVAVGFALGVAVSVFVTGLVLYWLTT